MNILETVPVGMLFLYVVLAILAYQAVQFLMSRSRQGGAKSHPDERGFKPEPRGGYQHAGAEPQPAWAHAQSDAAPQPRHIQSLPRNMWPQQAQPQMAQHALAYADPGFPGPVQAGAGYQDMRAQPSPQPPMAQGYVPRQQSWMAEPQDHAQAYAQQMTPVQAEAAPVSTMSPQMHGGSIGMPIPPSPVMMAHMVFSTRFHGGHAASGLFSPQVQYYHQPIAEQPSVAQAPQAQARVLPEPKVMPEPTIVRRPAEMPVRRVAQVQRPTAPAPRVAAAAGHGLEVVSMAKLAGGAPANKIGRVPCMSLESIRRQVA